MNIKDTYRAATEDERKFYEEELYPVQNKVLKIAAFYKDILYLSEGTALTRYYLNHRFSDDLDFFTKIGEVGKIAGNFIEHLQDNGLELEESFNSIYFTRFYIHDNKTQLKVEIVREHNHYGELQESPEGFQFNNLLDMGANKITAFDDRAEIKDIIDLYYLTKQLEVKKLFEIADLKREPVRYEHLLTINQIGVKGNALTREHIEPDIIEKFIEYLIEETENEIKKKEKFWESRLNELTRMFLWDFPPERRNINKHSIPILRRRLKTMNLPERRVLEKLLS